MLTGEGAKKYTEDDLTKFTSGLMNVLGFQSNTYSIKVKTAKGDADESAEDNTEA